MLKIRLSRPTYVNRRYVVFIDRDLKRVFPNKRKAEEFVTSVEKELNEALLFINEEFCNLTTFYRTYFMGDRDFKFKYEVENHFDLINNRLGYISSHTLSDNYNTMISNGLNVCFDSLCEICDLIDCKSCQRYDMLTRRRIELQKKIVTQYRGSFEAFREEASKDAVLKVKSA